MLANFWDPKTARVLFTAGIIALVFLFLYGARGTLTLFLFAILFAYFVEPLVAWLEKPLRGRTQAIGAVYFLLVALLVGLGFLIGPKIADEGKALAASLPSLLDRMGSGQLVFQFGRSHGWSQSRMSQIQSFFMAHRNDVLTYARAIGENLAEPAQHIWWLILIPILSLFFLQDGKEIAEGLVHLGRTPSEEGTVRGIILDVNVMLGSYIRAQLILAGLTLVAYTVFLSAMSVPFAFILGPLAGIFEFVPVVGPAIAAVSVVAIAVLTGYPHWLILIIFLGIWRLLQDYVSSPRIMGKSLEISPLAQIFAVLAGGEIGGVVGALISVPVVAGLRILWRRLNVNRGVDASQITASTYSRFMPNRERSAEGEPPAST